VPGPAILAAIIGVVAGNFVAAAVLSGVGVLLIVGQVKSLSANEFVTAMY
jgi:hypothetical protein